MMPARKTSWLSSSTTTTRHSWVSNSQSWSSKSLLILRCKVLQPVSSRNSERCSTNRPEARTDGNGLSQPIGLHQQHLVLTALLGVARKAVTGPCRIKIVFSLRSLYQESGEVGGERVWASHCVDTLVKEHQNLQFGFLVDNLGAAHVLLKMDVLDFQAKPFVAEVHEHQDVRSAERDGLVELGEVQSSSIVLRTTKSVVTLLSQRSVIYLPGSQAQLAIDNTTITSIMKDDKVPSMTKFIADQLEVPQDRACRITGLRFRNVKMSDSKQIPTL